MKTHLTLRTATLAIAATIPSVAFAQDTTDGAPNDVSVEQPSAITSQETALAVLGSEEARQLAEGAEGSLVTPFTVTADQLNPTYRDINPFYRDINAFYRDINPFYRDINPFYRDINPFYRDINPFYGNINAFWGDINAFWRDIVAFDAAYMASVGDFWSTRTRSWLQTDAAWEAAGGDLTALNAIRTDLLALISASEQQFGARVKAAEGGTFMQSFAQAVLERHGIDINDPASLANWTMAQRAAFYVDWHDSLMQYSGFDQVDHWMATINWNPAVTHIQGAYNRAVVGIIDSDFGATGDLANNLIWSGGSSTDLNGHGAGVASLIAGAHDGQDIMGIAPNATITAYNPFALDGTATWDDIAAGIWAIKGSTLLNSFLGTGTRASVINLSLGEAGAVASQGLADVFQRRDISLFNNSTVYVVAAGNDGIAQTTDVEWGMTTTSYSLLDPTMDPQLAMLLGYPVITQSHSDTAVIFVGSVDPMGNISGFSNTPGDACLLDNGVCYAGNELMNHFIVAPGELLLVSDGQGGVIRRSGTSFAAPLVSGAITLLHDRWPWLADHPHETTEIVFRSARDLGAPGVDPVYGWGLLDVTASQSPLDFNSLEFTLYQLKGKGYRSSNQSASNLAANGVQSWWETSSVFFTMFEKIGNTHRDFAVPMSSATYGKRTNALGDWLYLQDFVSARFTNWLKSGGSDSDGDGIVGISQVNSDQRDLSSGWALRYDAVMPRFTEDGLIDLVHSAATLQDPSGKLSLTVGHGEGAMALNGGKGFGLVQDSDRFSGGVNPILGFASGEAFMEASYKLGKQTTVSVGFTENRRTADEVPGISDAERFALRALKPHTASAMTLSLEHKLSPAISINGQWTRLREDEALLGVQSTLPGGLDQGTVTNAVSVSAHVDLGGGLAFDLSGTGARTDTRNDQVFNAGQDIFSTAGQISLSKNRVFGENDKLRVSFAQPLSVEAGTIEFTSLAVIDRQTGETGPVTQSIDLGTKRRLSGEVIYGAKLGNSTQFGLFGHYLSEGNPGEEESFVVGANIGWRF
ncbi:S8 family peptidase [Altererythrobacter sp. GH1-8]|uniref:S8 family peptidase n=1 Tax=Altererythrobacter sp. GH1-8 TaxID=3349333 RepID=UPI00374CD043